MIIRISISNWIIMIICAILTLISYIIWCKYKSADKAEIKFDPQFHLSCSSAEASFYRYGYARGNEIYSLFVDALANDYLELTGINVLCRNIMMRRITITKRKDYDGNNRGIATFLACLFAISDTITEAELGYYYYAFLHTTLRELNSDEQINRYYKVGGIRDRITLIFAAFFIFILTITGPAIRFSRIAGGVMFLVVSLGLIWGVIISYFNKTPYWKEREHWFLGTVILNYFLFGGGLFQDAGMLITHIFGIFCVIIICFFYHSINIRTAYGNEMYGKSVAFSNYLKSLSPQDISRLAKVDSADYTLYQAFTYALRIPKEQYESIVSAPIKYAIRTIEETLTPPGKWERNSEYYNQRKAISEAINRKK